jgi:hypothetical protein
MPGTYFNPIRRIFLNLSGGTVTGDTFFTQGVEATYLSGGTIYSGGTDLSLLITQAIYTATTSAAYLPLSGGTGGEYLFTGNTTGQTIFVEKDIIPIVDNNSFLGTISKKFKELHVTDIIASNLTGTTVRATTITGNTIAGNVLLSGNTNLYSIFQQIGTDANTAVQAGSNIQTGGTQMLPIVSLVSSPSVNNILASGASQMNTVTVVSISGGTVSGGTIYSGSTNLQSTFNTLNGQLATKANLSGATFTGQVNVTTLSASTLKGGIIQSGNTDLYSIFQQIGTDANTAVQAGSNIQTGGTQMLPVISTVASPTFNNILSSGSSQFNNTRSVTLSGGTVSGGTIYSGSTDLNVMFNQDRAQINTKADVSGTTFTGAIIAPSITDSGLVAGRGIYAGAGGLLKSNSGFTFDETSGNLFAQNIQIGSSSLSGTVVIWGDVRVMGEAVSAFTSNLFVEDNNIELNFNPSASTVSTSLGAGITIQDGSGVAGTDVFLEIRGTGTTVNNRSFTTNLADIRIRETGTISNPNGVRLIAENDTLDGGSF